MNFEFRISDFEFCVGRVEVEQRKPLGYGSVEFRISDFEFCVGRVEVEQRKPLGYGSVGFRISDFEFVMDKVELEKRTKRFALTIIKFVGTLPQSKTCSIIEYQLVKAGTSVGANYREANRAESRADFIHKVGIVEKEASESCFWLEICDEVNLGDADKRSQLLNESRELLAIFTSVGKSTKANRAHG